MEHSESPLVLEAMTLRGLGSYLYGARLEIRPLTILCGANGSGKSTWFRMLRILQDSQHKLPFSFADDLGHGEEKFHDYTNPLARPTVGYSKNLVSAAADREFGPLGTIGLHMTSCAPFRLAASLGEGDTPSALLLSGSLPHSFLADGRVPHGTRFRVRMTDPTDLPAIHNDDSELDRLVELVINDVYSIRFERRRPSEVRHYIARCTRAFWPGCDPEDRTEMDVAEFDVADDGSLANLRGLSGAAAFDRQEWFCRVATTRIRELLAKVLSSVYLIGAIRSTQRSADVDDEDYNDPRIIERRYVGADGRFTHVLARRFAYNEMHIYGSQSQGSINYSFSRVPRGVCEELLAARDDPTQSPARRIWELASEESKHALSRIESSTGRDANIVAARVLNDALRGATLSPTIMGPTKVRYRENSYTNYFLAAGSWMH